MKKNRNNVKGINPDLSKNKIRMRNEIDLRNFGLMSQSWLSFRHLTESI